PRRPDACIRRSPSRATEPDTVIPPPEFVRPCSRRRRRSCQRHWVRRQTVHHSSAEILESIIGIRRQSPAQPHDRDGPTLCKNQDLFQFLNSSNALVFPAAYWLQWDLPERKLRRHDRGGGLGVRLPVRLEPRQHFGGE